MATGVYTFDVAPQYPVRVTRLRRALASEGSALIQRRSLWSEGPLRRWSLSWDLLNDASVKRLRWLEENSRYGVRALDWTTPEGEAVVVQMSNLVLRRLNVAWAAGSLDLTEIR